MRGERRHETIGVGGLRPECHREDGFRIRCRIEVEKGLTWEMTPYMVRWFRGHRKEDVECLFRILEGGR